ncbi:MAG: oligoribonuclease, partial [Actinomycetota bacterium]
DEAGARALAYVRSHVATPRTAPLCGNSIGVDRRFLDAYLPELEGHLHYRSVDVSSLKELCRRWAPGAYRGRPGKQETHRALLDVRDSIAELAYYRATFLAVEAPTATDAPIAPDAGSAEP